MATMNRNTGLLDLNSVKKQPASKYIFEGRKFPDPTLLRLDVAFLSGLMDDLYHSLGQAGTIDLFILTDHLFGLPLMSLAAFSHEADSLHFGIFPPMGGVVGGEALPGAPVEPPSRKLDTSYHIAGCFLLGLMIIIVKFFEPQITALTLFDRGSSPHEWALCPTMHLHVMALIVDHLYLVAGATPFIVLRAVFVHVAYAHFRMGLWKRWRRRYLMLTTTEAKVNQPTLFKPLHRKVCLEFLDRSSVDEYEMLLLETLVFNGFNIRDPSKDFSLVSRPASPSATAAWKICISFAEKLSSRQKLLKQEKVMERKKTMGFMQDLIYLCADKAIYFLRRQPFNERTATTHHKPIAQKQVLQRFRKFVRWRKDQVQQRILGLAAEDYSELKADLSANLQTLSLDFVPKGRVLSFGLNEYGQLGVGKKEDEELGGEDAACAGEGRRRASGGASSSTNKKSGEIDTIFSVDGQRLRQVLASSRSSFFVSNKFIFACGSNRHAELGTTNLREVSIPTCLKTLRAEAIAQVASRGEGGDSQTLILTMDGRVYGAGESASGALTDFKKLQEERKKQIDPDAYMGPIEIPLEFPVRFVACGARFSGFLTGFGALFTCGDNTRGQLGISKAEDMPPRPGTSRNRRIETEKEMTKRKRRNLKPRKVSGEIADFYLVTCGTEHMLASSESKGLFAWGANTYGQCGVGHSKDVDDGPKKVTFRAAERAMDTPDFAQHDECYLSLAAGEHHSLVTSMTSLNWVWAFGSNVYGQCGIASTVEKMAEEQYKVATLIPLFEKKRKAIVSVSAALHHSLALDRDGGLYVFGRNHAGQLGSASKIAPEIRSPELLVSLAQYRVRQVSTGNDHTLVLI